MKLLGIALLAFGICVILAEETKIPAKKGIIKKINFEIKKQNLKQDEKNEKSKLYNVKSDSKAEKKTSVVSPDVLSEDLHSAIITKLQRLAEVHKLRNQSKNIEINGVTITKGDMLGLDLSMLGMPGDLNNIVAMVFATTAGIAAMLASVIGFIMPPITVINHILAIIALALLGVYLAEDHGMASYIEDNFMGNNYFNSYNDYDRFSDEFIPFDYNLGNGLTTSSYSNYRRSDDTYADLYPSTNALDGASPSLQDLTVDSTSYGSTGVHSRSSAAPPFIRRMARMVTDAVKEYTGLIGE